MGVNFEAALFFRITWGGSAGNMLIVVSELEVLRQQLHDLREEAFTESKEEQA